MICLYHQQRSSEDSKIHTGHTVRVGQALLKTAQYPQPLDLRKEITMTERMIENRIRKLQAIEVHLKELEEQAETLRTELKADLEEKGLDELQTANFMISWKEITSMRLDSKALKASFPDIYGQFVKQSFYRRFTVA